MGSILEMAARNELLRRAGNNTAHDFLKRIESTLVSDVDPESAAAPPVDAIEHSPFPSPREIPPDRPTWSSITNHDRASMTESSAWIPAVRPRKEEDE
jgi:HPr kinase/phosphorylase